ncbi:MAG: MBL fold metallo-hydrolase [Candidatus Bathyarchaeota archaeon]|nr:MBL fold metallo-hydrolase [Candidatus Bathyarchaeota archaeon]MCX8177473.1 MBL fold metallo-hydrolase [Candidatus Bathyarchaeota archaeon]MDW8194140.1 ComEC/Rec2 family competence protein [Nitrososphaerota archaeon]
MALLQRVWALLFTILLCATLICSILPITYGNSGFVKVYFFDVGQGDAAFIDTDGLDVLVDGGSSDAGVRLLGYLMNLNVSKIDIVIATHPHEDHIGGLVAVLKSTIATNTILYNGQLADTKIYSDFINLAHDKMVIAERGQTYILDFNVNLTILNPTQPLEFDDINSNSIVFRLQAGSIALLFMGDATFEAEESIIRAGFNLNGQVLKVGHHGSRYATSHKFLDAANPKYAIISAGVGNPYGHPHQETLQRLSEKGVLIYGTYACGTVVVSTDGQIIKVNAAGTMEIPEFGISLQDRIIYLGLAFILVAVFLLITYRESMKRRVKRRP